MRVGNLRHRITIEENTPTEDAAGQPIESWSTLDGFSNVPAEVMETGGSETLRGKQVSATATHVVRLRYAPGVTTEHRITWEGRTLNIEQARNPDGRRIELWLECTEAK